MPEEARLISVTEPDLEDIGTVLQTVFHYLLSKDLRNQYMNLTDNVRRSPLTNEVAKSIETVNEYLKDLDEDDDVSE